MENNLRSCNGDLKPNAENQESKNPVGNILPISAQLFYDFFGVAVKEKDQSTHQQNGQQNRGSIDQVIFPVFICTVSTQCKQYGDRSCASGDGKGKRVKS